MPRIKEVFTYTCFICDTEKKEKKAKEPCPKCGSCLTKVKMQNVERVDVRRTFVADERQHGGGI